MANATIFDLGSANFSTADPLVTSKQNHRYRENFSQATGTAVVDGIYHFNIGRTTGVFKAFEAAITGAVATGADRTVTIDLKKSTGAGAFASILSATVVFNNVSTLRVVSAATLSDTAIANDDMFQVTVTVAGAAGNQAQGLLITATYEENP